MRGLMLGMCVMSATALIDLTFEETRRDQWTCGNCLYSNGNRCNTGGSEDKFPFASDRINASNVLTQEQRDNGVSQATAVAVSHMRNLVETAHPNRWNTLFCSSYLDMYKFNATTAGSACVRAESAQSIIDTDNEVRDLYNQLGTENGYPSSYAVAKGKNLTDEQREFGVDGEGDVPSNWCAVYMRHMLCHIAFPQVILDPNFLTTGTINIARGALRAVKKESCEDVFTYCNRREPDEDTETKTDYILPILDNARGLAIEGNREELQGELNNGALCEAWAKGYGLAAAGTGIIDNNDNAEFTIEYSASSRLVTSSVLVVAASVLALLC